MVELPVSDNPKCEELVVTYGRLSLMSVELQEVFYLEKSEHSHIHVRFGDNVLHAIFRYQFMKIHLLSKTSSYTLSGEVQ